MEGLLLTLRFSPAIEDVSVQRSTKPPRGDAHADAQFARAIDVWLQKIGHDTPAPTDKLIEFIEKKIGVPLPSKSPPNPYKESPRFAIAQRNKYKDTYLLENPVVSDGNHQPDDVGQPHEIPVSLRSVA